MANDLIPKDDDGPMAQMPPNDDVKAAYELLGVMKGLRLGATFLRGAYAAALVKFLDERRWSTIGFPSQAAFLEAKKIKKTEIIEIRQELTALGVDLMNRFEEAEIPRKWRRTLTHVDDKKLIELKDAIKTEPDTDVVRDLIEAFYNKAAETEIAKRQAEENAGNWKKKAEDNAAEAKDAKKKLHDTEKQLADTKEYFGKSPTLGSLHRHALEAIAGFVRHIHRAGIATEDVKAFKRCFDELHDGLDEIWRSFCDPPAGMKSREDFIRLLQKDKGFTKEEAEGIADEYKFTA